MMGWDFLTWLLWEVICLCADKNQVNMLLRGWDLTIEFICTIYSLPFCKRIVHTFLLPGEWRLIFLGGIYFCDPLIWGTACDRIFPMGWSLKCPHYIWGDIYEPWSGWAIPFHCHGSSVSQNLAAPSVWIL